MVPRNSVVVCGVVSVNAVSVAVFLSGACMSALQRKYPSHDCVGHAKQLLQGWSVG